MSRGSHHVLARTSIPVTAVTYSAATYTGSVLTGAVASVTPSNATYSTPTPTQTNAGTYSTSITGSGAFNKTVSANWVINPASLVSFTIGAQTYSGSPLTPAVASVNPAAATYSTSFTNQTNAGTYSNSITGTTNYTGTISANFVVNPAPVTAITWTGVTYNAASQTPATASRTPAGATGTVGTAQTNAGTYSTTFTGTGNYTGTPSATWTISPAPMASVSFGTQTYTGGSLTPAVSAVSPAAATFTTSAIAKTNAGAYTDSSVTGTTNYTGTVTGSFTINPAPMVSVGFAAQTYTGSALTPVVNSVNPAAATYTISAVAKTNAGTYTDSSVTGTTNYTGTVTGSFVVNRASMVSVGFAAQTYTGSALTPVVNSVNPAAATYTTSAVAKTNAGTYSDSSVSGTTNYIGTVTGNFTVNPAPMVSVGFAAQTYTGSALTPVVNAVNPAAATYTTSAVAKTNAGTYSDSGITGTSNYQGTVTGSFTINAATVTAITWASNTYNGASQTPATASRTPAGATGNVGTAQTNAGSYTTTFTGTGNYTGSPTATWSINPAPVTFSYSNTSKTYNAAAQSPTVTPSDAAAAGSYSNGTTTSATNVGSYTITSSASGNYTGSGSSAWSIGQKPVSFSYTNTSKTYNGASQAPTVTVSDAAAAGSYSNGGTTSATNAGSYTITSAASGNYSGSGSSAWSIATAGMVGVTYANQTYTSGSLTPATSSRNPAGATGNVGASQTTAGTYSTAFTGTGNYSGTVYANFTIDRANQTNPSITGASSGVTGVAYSYTASGGNGTGQYVFGGSGSGATNPNSVTFGSPGTYSVTVYKDFDTNYNSSGTVSTGDITITAACHNHTISYSFDGMDYTADYQYTNCAGNAVYVSNFSNFPGQADYICARDGTVTVYTGSDSGNGSACS